MKFSKLASLSLLTLGMFSPSLALIENAVGQTVNDNLQPDRITVQRSSGTLISQALNKNRKRIAVLNMDFASTGGMGQYAVIWGEGGPSKGISDLLTNKLVKTGEFTIIERSRIAQILKEQGLGQSGLVDPATAAQVGRLLGAEIVIIGSITKFNIENQSGGFSFLGIGTGSSTTKATVQVSIRLVNTSTGEILDVAEGSGEASEESSRVSVLGVNTNSSSNGVDTLFSNASDKAVEKISNDISGMAPKLAALPPLLPTTIAVVADVAPGSVVINKGSRDGFQPGMKVSIERVVREVKDPQTGAVLRQLTDPIGLIELTDVDATSSVGKVIKTGKPFKVGDSAKAVE